MTQMAKVRISSHFNENTFLGRAIKYANANIAILPTTVTAFNLFIGNATFNKITKLMPAYTKSATVLA